MGPKILKRFYSCNIECILTGCITASYGNCSVSDRKTQQRVVRTAQYITGAKLPAIQDLYIRRCQRKALKLVKDSSHPSHRLFSLLPHGKRYRSSKSSSKRLLNSFYPPANQSATQTPLLRCCYYLLSLHSHFTSAYMYVLPQLPRLTCTPYIDSVLVPPVYSHVTVILLLLFKLF